MMHCQGEKHEQVLPENGALLWQGAKVGLQEQQRRLGPFPSTNQEGKASW